MSTVQYLGTLDSAARIEAVYLMGGGGWNTPQDNYLAMIKLCVSRSSASVRTAEDSAASIKMADDSTESIKTAEDSQVDSDSSIKTASDADRRSPDISAAPEEIPGRL